jgi:hypothetical protein
MDNETSTFLRCARPAVVERNNPGLQNTTLAALHSEHFTATALLNAALNVEAHVPEQDIVAERYERARVLSAADPG